MAEVRPWIGSYISVGQFKTLKCLTLGDCSDQHKLGSVPYLEEPDASKREKAVWAAIGGSFSEPVTLDDSSADYAPILA